MANDGMTSPARSGRQCCSRHVTIQAIAFLENRTTRFSEVNRTPATMPCWEVFEPVLVQVGTGVASLGFSVQAEPAHRSEKWHPTNKCWDKARRPITNTAGVDLVYIPHGQPLLSRTARQCAHTSALVVSADGTNSGGRTRTRSPKQKPFQPRGKLQAGGVYFADKGR